VAGCKDKAGLSAEYVDGINGDARTGQHGHGFLHSLVVRAAAVGERGGIARSGLIGDVRQAVWKHADKPDQVLSSRDAGEIPCNLLQRLHGHHCTLIVREGVLLADELLQRLRGLGKLHAAGIERRLVDHVGGRVFRGGGFHGGQKRRGVGIGGKTLDGRAQNRAILRETLDDAQPLTEQEDRDANARGQCGEIPDHLLVNIGLISLGSVQRIHQQHVYRVVGGHGGNIGEGAGWKSRRFHGWNRRRWNCISLSRGRFGNIREIGLKE